MAVELVPAYGRTEELKELFAEYSDLLLAREPDFRPCLAQQNFNRELECPEEKYVGEDQRLYLALAEGRCAGCIGLKRLDEGRCEMKRLYVRPQFQGRGIARLLASQVISDAKALGYRAMLLDTLPCLWEAVKLYYQLGFYEIPPYNDNPVKDTLFLQLDL